MKRRPFLHLLLSLVLLLSQQMAMAHVLAHSLGELDPVAGAASAASTGDARTDNGGKLTEAVAHAQGCPQCHAFTQLATPFGSTPRCFAPTHLAARAAAVQASIAHWERTPCAFRSRAPPQA